MLIPTDRSYKSKILWPLVVVASIIFFCLILFFSIGKLQSSISSKDGNQAEIERVHQGNFQYTVAAFGTLKSAERRSLVTQVGGAITEILLQAGSPVESNSVILKLTNPQLSRDHEMALLEHQEVQADLVQLNAELTDEYLTLVNDERMRLLELQTQEAELDARVALAEKNIVSQLELRREQMRTEQARLVHQLAQERKQSFEESRETKLDAGRLRLERAAQLIAMTQADLDALVVKSGMFGILQSLDDSIQLGQWLNQGETLGVVANLDKLYAELRVSASNASEVEIGMPVMLDIRGHSAEGKVTRVAPNVVRNQVQVDVLITTSLPITARPNLDVNADLVLMSKPDVLLIPRPPHFEPGRPFQVYVKQGNNRYRLVEVDVEFASNNQIVVRDGLEVDDQVLLINPEVWNFRPEIDVK